MPSITPISVSGPLVYTFLNLEILNEAYPLFQNSNLFTNVVIDEQALTITADYLQVA